MTLLSQQHFLQQPQFLGSGLKELWQYSSFIVSQALRRRGHWTEMFVVFIFYIFKATLDFHLNFEK
jgi:hypothetical protein